MKKVLILVEDLFNEFEFIYPFYRFQEAGFAVDVAGPAAKGTYRGKSGLAVEATTAVSDVRVGDYVAVVIPGGYAPDRMRRQKPFVSVVAKAVQQGLVIAAICHGTSLLIEADLLRGRKATGAAAIATDIRNAGATYVDAEVVVDGKLVTSRKPDDLPAFCRETIRLLQK
jgi:protease I